MFDQLSSLGFLPILFGYKDGLVERFITIIGLLFDHCGFAVSIMFEI